MADSVRKRYEFEDWRLDAQERLLLRDGEAIPLTPKVFDTLMVLVENAGSLVTKEEFMKRVWPDAFVEDAVLTQNVSQLRKVLGEGAIKTVPKKGYRFLKATKVIGVDGATSGDGRRYTTTLLERNHHFIAPVDDCSTSSITLPATRERTKSPSFRLRAAIAFLSPVVIAFLVWASWRHPWRREEIVERKLTLNSAENTVSGAAISPDHRYLAYTDNTGVYLKLIRTGETHLVALPPNFWARVDNWFPDGSHFLVSRVEKTGNTSLWSVSVFGGAPQHLADDASGGSVSPDGAHIAFHRGNLAYEGVWGREEWVMRSDGAEQVKVAAEKSDGSEVGAPTWSPDGKQIAYIRSTWAFNARGGSVEVNDWQSRSVRTLFSDSRLAAALHWLSDRRLVYALGNVKTSSRQDSSLWVASLDQSGYISSAPKLVAQAHGRVDQITGSIDGRVLVFRSSTWSPSVYIGSLASDGTHLLAKRRLTLDESVSIPFSWTPDNKAVLLSSDRNGTPEIFKQAVNEPLAETLVASADQLSQPRVTPDGSEILYISTPKSAGPEASSSIFAVRIGGGVPRLVLKDVGIYSVQCPRLRSPICFYSVAKKGTWETFRFDVRSGQRIGDSQLDPECNWSLSPDGSQRAIVPYHPDQETIQLRSTSTPETRDLVVKGWSGLMGAEWSADGRSLLVSWHNKPWESALLNVTLDGRVAVLLHSDNSEIWHAIHSPDGRSLAIAEASGTQNVWQVENF